MLALLDRSPDRRRGVAGRGAAGRPRGSASSRCCPACWSCARAPGGRTGSSSTRPTTWPRPSATRRASPCRRARAACSTSPCTRTTWPRPARAGGHRRHLRGAGAWRRWRSWPQVRGEHPPPRARDFARTRAGAGLVPGQRPVRVPLPDARDRAAAPRAQIRGRRAGAGQELLFRGPDEKLNLRAHNLELFVQMAEGVDEETWLHHLRQGDYSRWFRDAIKDPELADEAARRRARPRPRRPASPAPASAARSRSGIPRRLESSVDRAGTDFDEPEGPEVQVKTILNRCGVSPVTVVLHAPARLRRLRRHGREGTVGGWQEPDLQRLPLVPGSLGASTAMEPGPPDLPQQMGRGLSSYLMGGGLRALSSNARNAGPALTPAPVTTSRHPSPTRSPRRPPLRSPPPTMTPTVPCPHKSLSR